MGERKSRTRKPKKGEIPVQVRGLQLDPNTRERLTDVGFLTPHEPMIDAQSFWQDGMFHEVLTFESGKRLITVSNP